MRELRVASFHVRATAAQSARWKQASEAEGFASVGAWVACAVDSYLKARARAGAPIPLAWRRGRFAVLLEDREAMVYGHVSPPFAAFRGDGTGRQRRYANVYRLVYLPTRRVLATLRYFHDCKALAADLARRWVREEIPGSVEA